MRIKQDLFLNLVSPNLYNYGKPIPFAYWEIQLTYYCSGSMYYFPKSSRCWCFLFLGFRVFQHWLYNYTFIPSKTRKISKSVCLITQHMLLNHSPRCAPSHYRNRFWVSYLAGIYISIADISDLRMYFWQTCKNRSNPALPDLARGNVPFMVLLFLTDSQSLVW